MKKTNKKPLGRCPMGEALASNRSVYGRSGSQSRRALDVRKGWKRKPKKQKPKHLRYEDD